ncbi:hypothetical protein [Arcobacter sp.]|uniref:hypothetical protein n=1 Tax=Arcobacter sp. TaxID=1872629 RepID=UPI003D0E27D1
MSEKVTSKSTKTIIWDAYKEKLEEIKKLKNQTIAEKKEKATLSTATNVARDYNDITRGLNSFLNDFTQKVNNLNDIDEAIAIKSKEIKNLYDIEVEASSLEALKLAIEKLENEKDSLDDQLSKKKDEIDNYYSEKLEEAKKSVKSFKDDEFLKINREKDKENYNFEREKKLREDKLKDELAQKKKTFDEYVISKKKEIENEDNDLDKRVSEVEEKEKHINAYEEIIKTLEEKNKTIAEETKTETKKKADKEKEIALNIQKSKYESKIDHLNSIIDLKDNVIIDQKQNMTNLENKLDEAYKKVNELATNAVSSAKDKELTSHLADALRSRNDNK